MLGKIEHTDEVKVKSITCPLKPIMPHPAYDVSQLLGISAEDAASVTMEPILIESIQYWWHSRFWRRAAVSGSHNAIPKLDNQSTSIMKKIITPVLDRENYAKMVKKWFDTLGDLWQDMMLGPFMCSLWMLSASKMALVVIRLVAIRKCSRIKITLELAHALLWTTCHLTTCTCFERRAKPSAVRSRYPSMKSAMKSLPVTYVNSTRRTSQNCSISFVRRVACSWIPNTTFLVWYLGLQCPKASIQEGSCHAFILSILWSACTEDTAWKRPEDSSQERGTNGEWWIFVLEVVIDLP